MKKITAVAGLIFLLTLAISSCGGGGGGSSDGGSTPNTPPPTDNNSSNNNGGTTKQNTSTALITAYMGAAHQAEATTFTEDNTALLRQLAAQGLLGSGGAVVKLKDLKLSHINNFVNVCLQYVTNTKITLMLDKPSVKSLFTSYKTTDISEVTTLITNQYTARGLNVNQNVLSSALADVNNTYSAALLQIDAM